VVLGGAVWYRSRALTPAALYQRLPQTNAFVVYIDFDALRQAGIMELLSGSKVAQEPDYRSFVQETGFDYTQDMHAVMASFSSQGRYLLVKGRFDWKRLANYAGSQSGTCENSFCRMTGSAPDRLISFYPVRSNLMALAVSRDGSAATRLADSAAGHPVLPDSPFWVMAPGSAFKSNAPLPGEAGLLSAAVADAELVTLSFAPEKDRIVANLEVRCSGPAAAGGVATQLTRITSVLRQAMSQGGGGQTGAKNLGDVLAAGNFWTQGNRALGKWPLDPSLLRTLLR
jgi:hypothetical protein